MHTISVETAKSAFVDEPHLVIIVDGRPLDLVLHAHDTQYELNGLVPTLLGWLADEAETAIVWERVLPPDGETAVAPMLMCPDDLDFFCTLVVVEVETSAEAVRWTRLGLDESPQAVLPRGVGSVVKWFDGLGPFTFDKARYREMSERFADPTAEK